MVSEVRFAAQSWAWRLASGQGRRGEAIPYATAARKGDSLSEKNGLRVNNGADS